MTLVQSAESPERQAFGIAAHLGTRLDRRQALLEIDELPALLRSLGDTLTSEIELLRLERKIDDDVRGSLFQNQREFYLQEQLKAIHRELGQEDGDDVDELDGDSSRRRGCPRRSPCARGASCASCASSSPMSPEATVVRNYLDWIARAAVDASEPTTCSTSRTRAASSTRTTTASRR